MEMLMQVQKKLRAMCAVMRVAVALDRCDTSAIQHVHVFQQSESIILVRFLSHCPRYIASFTKKYALIIASMSALEGFRSNLNLKYIDRLTSAILLQCFKNLNLCGLRWAYEQMVCSWGTIVEVFICGFVVACI